MRNLTTRWAALSQTSAAVRHYVDKSKAGNVHAAEITDAAAGLYRKLAKGTWWDGTRERNINHDYTKLRYAKGLTDMERKLVKDL